jgi:hypothetical protein
VAGRAEGNVHGAWAGERHEDGREGTDVGIDVCSLSHSLIILAEDTAQSFIQYGLRPVFYIGCDGRRCAH